MKNIFKTIAVAVILFSFASQIFAQEPLREFTRPRPLPPPPPPSAPIYSPFQICTAKCIDAERDAKDKCAKIEVKKDRKECLHNAKHEDEQCRTKCRNEYR